MARRLSIFSLLGEMIDVAQSTGHAPVLERSARVHPVVLEIKAETDHLLQAVVGLDQGGMSLPEINDVLQRY